MTWLQFGFDEICDLIFNSRLFHNDAVKYQKLEKISYGMTDNAMHSILVNGIFMRTQIIIVLRRIIDNTEIDCQEIALQ